MSLGTALTAGPDDVAKAAEAIYKLRFPAGFQFDPHTDAWAVQYAEAALSAVGIVIVKETP